MFDIEVISEKNRLLVDKLIADDWSGPFIAVHNTLYDTRTHPGFVAMEAGSIIGYILYNIADGDCEITVLESHSEGRGVGRALVDEVICIAEKAACRRVWLITSNDCVRAFGFYQKYGFDLRSVNMNAMDAARKLKPQIPLVNYDGIPVKHEFEFEIILSAKESKKSQLTKPANPTYRPADVTDIEHVTDLLYELYEPMLGLERDELLEENKTLFADERHGFFLAFEKDGPVGVAHVARRDDYVNGMESSPCGYLEAVYVKPEYRMNGIAVSLVRLCEAWAKERGCREFASDCLLDNTESYNFHLRIGFAETERCIFFRKVIMNTEVNCDAN